MKVLLVASALLGSILAFAAEDADQILKRFLEADARNQVRANQYTHVEHVDHFGYEKNNERKKFRSETFEVMFVEGEEYKKLIARADRPLEASEQAKEDKKLKQTAAERRKQRKSGMFQKSVDLGRDSDLLTLFDNRVADEDVVQGRKVWVIESTPRSGGAGASSKREKEVKSFRRTLWIDQADGVALRSMHTVVGEHVFLMRGSTMTWEFEKFNEEAWLVTSLVIDGRMQIAKMIKPRVRTEYRNSQFQKFDVKSTITVEQAGIRPSRETILAAAR